MRIEVDQSGRMENTRVPTVLAFSDGESFSIMIPAVVKREVIQQLRSGGLKGTSLYIRLFATGLYLLLRGRISKVTEAVVDIELVGYEAAIKQHLLALLAKAEIEVERGVVSFARIGKKSRAHALALQTFRGEGEPGREVSTEEILREFEK